MYYQIKINGETFSANRSELEMFKKAFEAFTGEDFEQSVNIGNIKINPTTCYIGERFHDINQPNTCPDYDIAYAGDDGAMGINEAENYAVQHFGVHFQILVLIDGAIEYFFSTV